MEIIHKRVAENMSIKYANLETNTYFGLLLLYV